MVTPIHATPPRFKTDGVIEPRIREMADEAAAEVSRSGPPISSEMILEILSAGDLADPELMTPQWLRKHATWVQEKLTWSGA